MTANRKRAAAQRERVAHGLDHGAIDRALRSGFAYFDATDERNTFTWHRHARHQLMFVEMGIALVQTAGAVVTLSRDYAALIPAGAEHETTVSRGCEFGSLFFQPEKFGGDVPGCRLVRVTPLLREMCRHVARWKIESGPETAEARRFFAAIADVVRADSQSWSGLGLPTATSEGVRRLIAETGLTWRAYLRLARTTRALQLLETREMTVAEVAFEVGFESLSAFTHAFKENVGWPPSDFLRRRQ